ncbi:MAG TPA: SDR family NAD(P)-dependent oxidoreductase [Polyangiaceae bacterium]|nr:SDR family NAD(P)-dependent oxidoreductase [Polyangiaceae bacterium]
MILEGKVVLVSGASSGIGLVAARMLAARGAQVVFAARSLAVLERAVRGLPGAMAVQLDVTSDASVRAAGAAVMARYGRVDVLVNNAGNGGRMGFLLEQDPQHLRAMFDVHVFGMERMTRALLPHMLARGTGTIVNVASTIGYVPMPAAAAYCAAKAAVLAFSESLRGEFVGTGVNLLLYSPPHTQTEAGQLWPLDLPKTFTPEFAAETLVHTLEKDKRDVLAGGNNMVLWLQRVSPRLALHVMRGIGLRAAARAKQLAA